VRGLLAPQAFIDLAEQTELILPLGAWVLHEACRMAVSLQDRPGVLMTVAVNLSGRQLSDRGLVGTVRAALQAAGCSADRLVFEVTETALVTDMAAAVDSLRELQALGAGVAIDDFGTGYAPLTYLKQLAADDLKIDRSFVRGLGTDSYDTAIVASLISLAHNLNVRCVAEGVETVEQLTLLQQLGCDFAQGFLFSRPVDAMSLGIWLDLHLTTGLPGSPPTPPGTSQVPRILAMHQNGDSAHTIAAALNAEGSHTVRGRRWSAKSVTQTLGEALA
jgi:EAL domain-containing protein (putative c-di-GMP-specific phosphodiesterase class I)